MIVRKLGSLAMLLGIATIASAAEPDGPRKLSSADLDRMVAAPLGGGAPNTLPTGETGPKVLVLRRTKTGEVEVHEALNDLFVVRAGRATVKAGGTVSGNRQTAPGEWRGGTISDGADFELAPGDVLWIPAGLPHQVVVPDGGEFSYLAFKSPK